MSWVLSDVVQAAVGVSLPKEHWDGRGPGRFASIVTSGRWLRSALLSGVFLIPQLTTIAMKRLSLASLLAICGLILSTATGSLLAQNEAPAAQPGGSGAPGAPGGRQGRGNWDPEQMRQRMMERVREQLAVKDGAEWSVIESRIKKISDSRSGMGRGFGGPGGGPGGPGGQGAPGGQGGQGGRQGRGGFGQANPDAEVLQTALDSGASADDIKVKLTAYRAAAKVKEGQLEKAQDELRQLLSVKQEARAVLLGLLK